MITIFNRKLLYSGRDAQELARIKAALDSSDIKYEIDTKRSAGPFSKEGHRPLSGTWLARGGYASVSADKVGSVGGYDEVTYDYSVYVENKDFEHAQKAINE